jgi:putative flippase GtrA
VAAGLGGLVRRWIAFHTTKVFTILLNQVLFAALLMVHLPYLAAYLFCVIVCTAINYHANDTYVFRSAPLAPSGKA